MSFLQILSVLVVFSASVYCNTDDVSILQKLEALDNRMKSMEDKLKNCETDFEGIKPFIQGLATDVTELSTNFNETKTEIISMKSNVNDLEDLSKLIGAESCKQLGNAGLTVSKTYNLDPDGKNRGTY